MTAAMSISSADTLKRFSVDDYNRMAEVGIIAPEDRVELLDGQVAEMSPIGTRHAACVDVLTALFSARLAGRGQIRVQGPVRLDNENEPEPDIALLNRRPDGYREAHPGPDDVHLIVEVADKTLQKDRLVKLPIYARSGVSEVRTNRRRLS